MFVASGQTIPIEVVFSTAGGAYHLFAESGSVVRVARNRWRWTAPRDPGPYRLVLTNGSMTDTVCIDATVVIAAEDQWRRPAFGFELGGIA
jgi:hypothetical protein